MNSEQRASPAWRWFIVIYLLVTGSLLLVLSMALLTAQAFGLVRLPDLAVAVLAGSVAVEFVGMLWAGGRFFLPH